MRYRCGSLGFIYFNNLFFWCWNVLLSDHICTGNNAHQWKCKFRLPCVYMCIYVCIYMCACLLNGIHLLSVSITVNTTPLKYAGNRNELLPGWNAGPKRSRATKNDLLPLRCGRLYEALSHARGLIRHELQRKVRFISTYLALMNAMRAVGAFRPGRPPLAASNSD